MTAASIIRKTAADFRKVPNWTDFQAERDAFQWADVARRLYGEPGGPVNIATLALERSSERAKIAFCFLARDVSVRDMTYGELAAAANRFCNVLRGLGVRPVERVFVLAGRIPELYVAVLGALKNGNIVTPLFSAFGPEPIATRMNLGGGRVLVTTDALYERKVAKWRERMPTLRHVLLVAEDGGTTNVPGTLDLATLMAAASDVCAAVPPAPTFGARRMISPAARKRATELGVDLERVVGSGPQGAVTLEDVEKAAAAKLAPPADKAAAMRQAIAAAMARSKREIPHYYVAEDIPLEKALAWLAAANETRPLAERLLPAALLLKAVATTLKRYPELNGHYRDGAFQPTPRINLGVAISLRRGGLLAPALLDAGAKSLTGLMQELADLVQRARAGSLKSAELGEGTITVTNLGDQGSHSVFGVIYPPQVALIGFGRIGERPWAEKGVVRAMPIVTASLAADHRVSDGHRGALFLRELAEQLQHPEELDT